MWKYILCFCLFIALCFMVPSFFIDFAKVSNVQKDMEKNKSDEKILSNEEMTINLLLSESKQIIKLTMNDYIKGVLLRRNASNL